MSDMSVDHAINTASSEVASDDTTKLSETVAALLKDIKESEDGSGEGLNTLRECIDAIKEDFYKASKCIEGLGVIDDYLKALGNKAGDEEEALQHELLTSVLVTLERMLKTDLNLKEDVNSYFSIDKVQELKKIIESDLDALGTSIYNNIAKVESRVGKFDSIVKQLEELHSATN